MFLREAFTFYYGICPNPLPHEYETMCETLCNKYPELKDKLPVDEKKPWVSKDTFIQHSPCVSKRYLDTDINKKTRLDIQNMHMHPHDFYTRLLVLDYYNV